MIRLNVIDEKTLTADDAVDLTSKLVTVMTDLVVISYIVEVDELSEMRPDVISYAAYGTHDHVDIILKFNGVSNPYSIKTGDVLAIPDLYSYQQYRSTNDFKPIQNQRKKIMTVSDALQRISTNSNRINSAPGRRSTPVSPFSKSDDGILIF